MTDYQKMLGLFTAIGVKFMLSEGYASTGGKMVPDAPQSMVQFQAITVESYDGEYTVYHEFLMDGSYWRTSAGIPYSA